MEIASHKIDPFQDFIEEDDDYDQVTGDLSEKGLKKMQIVMSIIKQFEERNKTDQNMLDLLKDKLDQTYDQPESKGQEKLKELMRIYQSRGDEINDEDQFSRFTLRMDMSKQKDREMLRELSKGRSPSVHSLSLGYIKTDSIEDVIEFIDKGFPNKVEALIFNFSGRVSSDKDLLDLSLFIDHLVGKSYLIINEIQFWNGSINEETLNKIMTYFCHVKKLWICWSKFRFATTTNKLGFNMAYEPEVEEINFEGGGDAILNDWENGTEDLEAILEAISFSSIKTNLKQVLFDDGNIEESVINEILNKYGIENKI